MNPVQVEGYHDYLSLSDLERLEVRVASDRKTDRQTVVCNSSPVLVLATVPIPNLRTWMWWPLNPSYA